MLTMPSKMKTLQKKVADPLNKKNRSGSQDPAVPLVKVNGNAIKARTRLSNNIR